MNLGWKLAQVVKGISPESLLDTYHSERHPVGARVLRNTMAAVALRREDDRTKALRDTMAELLGMAEPRMKFAAMLAGLDIHYDLGAGHPVARTPHARSRPQHRKWPAAGLQPAARWPAGASQLRRDRRPRHHVMGRIGFRLSMPDTLVREELPALGAVTAPTAVLIRPDGYVAWVGDQTRHGLADALTTWFGAPAAA